MLFKELQDVGLNETEAKIYLAALELGQTTVGRISQKSGIKRTTIYLSLENLIQKGLVSQVTKNGRRQFFAEDPRNLEKIAEERKNRVSKLVPELLAFTNLLDKKPTIRFFEGREGVKEVLNDLLNYPEQEALMMYSESSILDFEDNFFSEYYVPERIKRKISVRAIIPDNEIMRVNVATNEKSLRRSRLIPPDLFKIQIEIMIYGKNKINICSFMDNFGFIIESEIIHNSFKSIFETMWATSAKEI